MQKSPSSDYPGLKPYKRIERVEEREADVAYQPYALHETLEWIERCQGDPWYKSQMPITWRALNALIGGELLNREGREVNVVNVVALSRLISVIERREIIFPKRSRNTQPTNKPYFIYLEPPERPKIIQKMSLWSVWGVFCRCATCNGNQWLPIMLNDEAYVACYHCLPPDQYRVVRAASLGFSLIDEYAKQYYCV